MNRTLLYDRLTGELLHSHYEVRAVEPRNGGNVRLSAPAAVEPDGQMAEIATRGLDIERLGFVTTSVAPQSSRRMARFVDVKTGRLRSRRLERTDDIPSRKEQ